MNRLAWLSLPVALMVATLGLGGDDPSADDKELDGAWVVRKAERDGKAATELEGATYLFKDRTMTIRPADPSLPPRSATFRILPPYANGKPKRIAFTPKEGPNQGEGLEGVFRFRDGMLEICHCSRARNTKGFEPADFVTKPGSGWVLLALKKKD